jgi:dihydrodipicolinate synthase/N-acetylneuraminate lyase
MDPNQTYLDMFHAMKEGNHETARELAQALTEWFAKGGFYPYQYTPEAMHAYINSVLWRTAYLDMQ